MIKEKVRGFTRRVVRTFLSTPLRKWVTLKHIGRSRSGKGSLNKKKITIIIIRIIFFPGNVEAMISLVKGINFTLRI